MLAILGRMWYKEDTMKWVNNLCIVYGLLWVIGAYWYLPPDSWWDVVALLSLIPVFVVYIVFGEHSGIVY